MFLFLSFFSLRVILVAIVNQEASIPPLFLYMSFELGTCSLRDVIVIVWMIESISLSNIIENKCTIITPMRKQEKTRALVLKLIRLLFVSLWEKRHERRRKNAERRHITTMSVSCWLYYLHHQRVVKSSSSSKSFTLLNDEYHPHSIHKEIHWELLSSSVSFLNSMAKGEKNSNKQSLRSGH